MHSQNLAGLEVTPSSERAPPPPPEALLWNWEIKSGGAKCSVGRTWPNQRPFVPDLKVALLDGLFVWLACDIVTHCHFYFLQFYVLKELAR